jgi:hypothetical protein
MQWSSGLRGSPHLISAKSPSWAATKEARGAARGFQSAGLWQRLRELSHRQLSGTVSTGCRTRWRRGVNCSASAGEATPGGTCVARGA